MLNSSYQRIVATISVVCVITGAIATASPNHVRQNQTAKQIEREHFRQNAMDTKLNPCVDFYSFSCSARNKYFSERSQQAANDAKVIDIF